MQVWIFYEHFNLEAEAANGKGSHDMSAADPQSMIKISANETAEYSVCTS